MSTCVSSDILLQHMIQKKSKSEIILEGGVDNKNKFLHVRCISVPSLARSLVNNWTLFKKSKLYVKLMSEQRARNMHEYYL